jgi:hypothetical protein
MLRRTILGLGTEDGMLMKAVIFSTVTFCYEEIVSMIIFSIVII